MKEIKNPNSRLPLSHKNNLGNFKNEKLKNKKITKGINIAAKKISTFCSDIKKWVSFLIAKKTRIIKTEIVEKLKLPSIPSK